MTKRKQLITDRVRSFYNVMSEDDLKVEQISPFELIMPQRLDVLMKLYYIDAKVRGRNIAFAKEFYAKHISAITYFTNKENGQNDKNSISAFVCKFDLLIESFQQFGFNKEKSVIPVSSDNIILDGAHRLACAIYFNIPVTILRLHYVKIGGEIEPCIYDYDFFKEKLLEEKYLDIAIKQYVKYSKRGMYIACIWPIITQQCDRDKIIGMISENHPVIGRKNIELTFFSFDRFVAQVYMHDAWVGSIDDNFSGSREKSKLTYHENSQLSLVLYEGMSKEDTLNLKDKIRAQFNLGKHSIHITDTNEQTEFIVNIAFNRNSLLFLQFAKTAKFTKDIKKIYGLKKSEILSLNAAKAVWGLSPLITEEYYLRESEINIRYSLIDIEIIPETHFYYLGMKFPMPERSIVNQYYNTTDAKDLISIKQLKESIFDKIKYKMSLSILKIKIRVRVFAYNHSLILNLAKRILRK